MSIRGDIKNQVAFLSSSSGLGLGQSAAYYPAVLEGQEDDLERVPSEEASIAVTGILGSIKQSAPGDAIRRAATFTIAYSSNLGFTPKATDRIEIGSRSYLVKDFLTRQMGDTPISYTLILESN